MENYDIIKRPSLTVKSGFGQSLNKGGIIYTPFFKIRIQAEQLILGIKSHKRFFMGLSEVCHL